MSSAQHTPAVLAPSSEVSVLDLAHLIAEAAGLAGVHVTDGSADGPSSMPMSGRPSIADALPASIALGLTPSVDLAEGIARTHSERVLGASALAAPVFDPSGELLVGMGLAGPSERMRQNRRRFEAALRDAAARLTALVAGRVAPAN